MRYLQILTKSIVGILSSVFAALIICLSCGEKEPELLSRPWINTGYRDLSDSELKSRMEQADTLAAMVLAWHYMEYNDTTAAARILSQFNKFPQTASQDLNYLTGRALMAAKSDSLAILYFLPLSKSKIYPDAVNHLANLYKRQNNYKQALKIYQAMDQRKWEGLDDSMMICQAENGDTAVGIKFAMKMLNQREIGKAARYFEKFVSFKRGVSPALWSFGAGKAYAAGNNPTRAAVFLENADAETSFAELSYLLGMTYYRLEVFDSTASKLGQAMALGDSSVSLLVTLMNAYSRDSLPSQALQIAGLGLKLHPEIEDFYIFPSKYYFEIGNYAELHQLATRGYQNVKNSHRIDAYYAASRLLVGDSANLLILIDSLIAKYRFVPRGLYEIASLFAISLGRNDIATRLNTSDPIRNYPESYDFLNWYNAKMNEGSVDSCRIMLENWIALDSVAGRRELMQELYRRDFLQDGAEPLSQ